MILAFWADWSSWFEELRRLAPAEAFATWPIPPDPGLRYDGRGGRRRPTIRGFCRAEYEIDGEAIQLDIDVGVFANAIQLRGSKRPSLLQLSGGQDLRLWMLCTRLLYSSPDRARVKNSVHADSRQDTASFDPRSVADGALAWQKRCGDGRVRDLR